LEDFSSKEEKFEQWRYNFYNEIKIGYIMMFDIQYKQKT